MPCGEACTRSASCRRAPLRRPRRPAINIGRTATPGELPIGGGHVDFTFLVTNPGTVALSSLKVTDVRCPGVTFSGGDANSNDRLDPGETWRYGCSGRLVATITDSATALYGTMLVRDSDHVTVTVGLRRPAVHLEIGSSPSQLPVGGGRATLSYVVTNVGNVAVASVSVASVSVTDTPCAPVRYGSGDTSRNDRLDLSETWRFSCTMTVWKATTGRARVSGNVNGSGLHHDAGPRSP